MPHGLRIVQGFRPDRSLWRSDVERRARARFARNARRRALFAKAIRLALVCIGTLFLIGAARSFSLLATVVAGLAGLLALALAIGFYEFVAFVTEIHRRERGL